MKEVLPYLYVGSDADYEAIRDDADWSSVACAKEPWHREALGYTGRGAPREHPEYLWVRRDRRLILNMVDADRAAYFDPAMMDTALAFIEVELDIGQKVLLHCNQGLSRAPGLALLYMFKHNHFVGMPYDVGETEFRNGHYPPFQPRPGIREYVRTEWRRTCPGS